MSCTTLLDAVTRSEDAWKTNTALGSPWPLRVRGLAAVMLAVAAWPNAYTPGTRVWPPSWLSPATNVEVGDCPEALTKAVVRSFLAVVRRAGLFTDPPGPVASVA